MTGLEFATDTPAGTAPAEDLLGAGIRSERQRQGLTLTELAERSDLSPSALSQIERGVTDPSISSLRRIANALGIGFFQFLVQAGPPHAVVRKTERRTISFPNRTLQYQLLTPNLRGPFEVLALELAPGAASGEEALGHDSDECLLVLHGDVEVEIAGHVHSLAEGDAVSIARNLPHRVVNPTRIPAEVLTIISPANTF
jgi:transcriptional regulator with XRE-family HTH domain